MDVTSSSECEEPWCWCDCVSKTSQLSMLAHIRQHWAAKQREFFLWLTWTSCQVRQHVWKLCKHRFDGYDSGRWGLKIERLPWKSGALAGEHSPWHTTPDKTKQRRAWCKCRSVGLSVWASVRPMSVCSAFGINKQVPGGAPVRQTMFCAAKHCSNPLQSFWWGSRSLGWKKTNLSGCGLRK